MDVCWRWDTPTRAASRACEARMEYLGRSSTRRKESTCILSHVDRRARKDKRPLVHMSTHSSRIAEGVGATGAEGRSLCTGEHTRVERNEEWQKSVVGLQEREIVGRAPRRRKRLLEQGGLVPPSGEPALPAPGRPHLAPSGPTQRP